MQRHQSQQWRTAWLVHAACALNTVFVALWLVALLLSVGRLPGELVSGLAAFVPLALANIILDCLAVRRMWRGISDRPLVDGAASGRMQPGVLLSPVVKR